VGCVEAARYLYWFIFDKAYNQSLLKNDSTKPSYFMVSVAVGWSFGVSHSFIIHLSLLVHSLGPGFFATPSCPTVSLYYINSLMVMCMILSHIMLGVIAFNGYKRNSKFVIILVAVLHLALSYMTYANTDIGNCWIAVGLQFGFLVILSIVFFILYDYFYTFDEYKPIEN